MARWATAAAQPGAERRPARTLEGSARAASGIRPQDAAYSTDRGIAYAIQQKYPDYTSPVRLASKLEADYITAEAQGTIAQKALIDARRAANGQPPVAITDPDSTLTEFLTQRGFDFFLEGKRMGDFRRHPTNIIGLPVPGSTYWKPGFSPGRAIDMLSVADHGDGQQPELLIGARMKAGTGEAQPSPAFFTA